MLILFNIQIPAEEDITVDINIIDQPAQFENNKPKIIAGLWHTITFEGISNTEESLILTAFKGTNIPTEKNKTNYYQWKFLPSGDDSWETIMDYQNGSLKSSRCSKKTNEISYCIGIFDYLPGKNFYNEEWTLTLQNSQDILYSDTFYLENPTRGFAKSHGDRLSFSVDPFTKMQTKAGDYLILKNTGNIPLNITLDFDSIDDLLTYTESSNQIPAFSQQNYKLELSSHSWKPQRISQRGSAQAKVSEYYMLDEEVSGTAISLQPALVIDVPTINIFVGHSNYELTTLDSSTGFSFQYQKSVSMNEGETKTVNAYLSGEGTAKVSVETNDNVSVLQIKRNGQPSYPPFTVISTNAEEQVISVKLKALGENRHGKITYTIETDDDINTFNTRIKVGPPATSEQPASIGATSPVTIVVLLALIVAAGYMLYNHLVHGRSDQR